MSYDVELADRIREVLAAEPDLSERRMFGGLAFMVGGRMAVVTSRTGGLMVRVDPNDAERLLTGPGVTRMEMKGRPMKAWLLVEVAQVRTTRHLTAWVRRGVAAARAVPAD